MALGISSLGKFSILRPHSCYHNRLGLIYSVIVRQSRRHSKLNRYSDANLELIAKALVQTIRKDLADDSFDETVDLFDLDPIGMTDTSMANLWSYIDRTSKLAQWVTF